MSLSDDSVPFDPFAGPALVGVVDTTEPQREIWTACQLGEDASLAYNESVTVFLTGALDAAALEQALGDLVVRHEALRSTVSADGLSILIAEAGPVAFELSNLEHLSAEEQKRELARLADEAVRTPFDLQSGPLFRASLYRLGASSHALLFTAHHIVCDGWSTAVALQDWARLYNARACGFAAELDPAPTLAGYEAFLRDADPARRRADEEFWVKNLAGQLPIFDLPTDRPRPPRKTFQASRRDRALDRELIQKVKQVGAKSRASLFATLLAAFDVLLHRFSQAEDLVVGIPVAGQSGTEFGGLLDHCVNMLPIRAQVVSSAPFGELLGRVRTALLDAQDHQSLTFGSILTKLPLARDPSRLPLVNIIFNLDRGLTSEGIGFQDIVAKQITNARAYENFDLFLNAVDIDGRIELECQYNTSLYDAETVDGWLESYELILRGLVLEPGSEVRHLPILTPRDQALLNGWNQTHLDFPRDKTVAQWIAETSARSPDKIAVSSVGSNLTYAELAERSDAVARALVSSGVQPGSLVGLCAPRDPDLVASALGIWKAGAAYVPLDPDYPRDRLAYMIEDAAMSAVITTGPLQADLGLVAPVVLLQDEIAQRGSNSAVALPTGRPEDVAYVIYTSGSTGKPKGVLVPQRSVVNLLTSVAVAPGLTERDVALAVTTLSFDIAVSEIWLPLVSGATIALATREIASDGSLLKELCEREGVTFIDATPATYRLLLGAGWRPSQTQTLICTGEAMPLDLACTLLPDCRALWNGYGPTETTVWSTFWQVAPGFHKILIGRPVANTEIYIFDPLGNEVPVGVSGEIFIGGEGVTHGYLGRPDLTAERFLPDPRRPGYRMYKTGDLGRYLRDGMIECLGRNDHQVKLRGFRIELGEIEAALMGHPAIDQAAVALREDRPGDARLVGYLVCRAGENADPAALRAHLKGALPEYMIPATYVTLLALPLTPSGKVDRKALPAPGEQASAAQGGDYVAPETESEQLLSGLWGELLGLGRVSVADDFFALGGHSLLASQVLGRLRRDHGIELNFRKFFEAPTIRELARVVDALKGSSAPKPAGISRRSGADPVPLTVSQERNFVLEEMHPAQKLVHNLPSAWILEGPVQLELLQRAQDLIFARHETLRTTFHKEGQELVQRVSPSASVTIEAIDLRFEPEAVRELRFHELAQAKTAILFDLEKGPLFRAVLFRLGDEKYAFYSCRHNLIWDGWSFDIFVSELAAAYTALEAGQEPKLPELPVSYGDFVLWHRDRLKSDRLLEQQRWWQAELADAPADLALPSDFPRPQASTYRGGSAALSIESSEIAALTALAHKEGTTLFMVFFAAYTTLLSRYAQQDDVLVGLPVRARLLPEVEGLIGPFINTVILRTKVDKKLSFVEHLRRVRDSALEAMSREEMPLEMLGDRPPVVRALFSFQDARHRPVQLGQVKLRQIDVEPPAASNDLMIWCMERQSELVLVANYSSDLFRRSTVERLLRSMKTLLQAVREDSSRSLESLPLVAPIDGEPTEAMKSQGPANPEGLAHQWIARQASARGASLFLQGRAQRVSYGDLARELGSFAALVASRDLPADALVAVIARDPIEMTLGVLGLLSNGITAVPLPLGQSELIKDILDQGKVAAAFLGKDVDVSPWGEMRVPLLLRSDLASAQSDLPERRPEPHGAAIAAPIWNAEGELEFETLTHQELAESAYNLALRLGSDSPDVQLSIALDWSAGPALTVLALMAALQGGAVLHFGDDVSADAWLGVLGQGPVSQAFGAPRSFEFALEDRVGLPARVVFLGGADTSLREEVGRAVSSLDVLDRAPRGLHGYFLHHHEAGGFAALGAPLTSRAIVQVRDDLKNSTPLGVEGNLVQVGEEVPGFRGRLLDGVSVHVTRAARPEWLDREGFRMHERAPAALLERRGLVREAYMKVFEAKGAAPRLVLFYAPRDHSLTESELRRAMQEGLPAALVPNHFVEVTALPRLSDGGVDVGRLEAPFSRGGKAHVEPRTEHEKILAACFREVLGISKVSVYDNFFDLGGHSLLCLRAVAWLSSQYGLTVSPRAFLLNTLEQAAQGLAAQSGPAQPVSTAPSSPPPDEERGQKSVFKKIQSIWSRK